MNVVRFAVLGNPVVDALARVSPSELQGAGLIAGDTNQLPMAAMMELGGKVEVELFQSGGAGANLAYTLGKLGNPTCFLGPLGVDPAGRHFFKEMVAAGLTVITPQEGYRTTELFVLVTPDGARTMAQPQPRPPSTDDAWVDETILQSANWLVVEGYVACDYPTAVATAMDIAAAKGMKTCLLLPAPHVAANAAPVLWHVLEGKVDLVIGNVNEFEALTQSATLHQRSMLESIPRVITHSGEAATFDDGKGHQVAEPTRRIATPRDNTGAGDAFAAGFLAVYGDGGDPAVALRRGHLLGGAVIQNLGPRLPDPMAVWLTADTVTNSGI